jgi:RHS repeat-associated protein
MNVTAVVDTSGSVVERTMYDPYGNVTVLDADWSSDADGASDVSNEILYAGYRYDTETGLYHVRHRMYHPTLGRWMTRDPIGYADGMNAHEYVGGTPVLWPDPEGLEAKPADQGPDSTKVICIHQSLGKPYLTPKTWMVYNPDSLNFIVQAGRFFLGQYVSRFLRGRDYEAPVAEPEYYRPSYEVLYNVRYEIEIAGPTASGDVDSGRLVAWESLEWRKPDYKTMREISQGKHKGVPCIKHYVCQQECRKKCCNLDDGVWGPWEPYTAEDKEVKKALGKIGQHAGGWDCIVPEVAVRVLSDQCSREGLCGRDDVTQLAG